jgi:uncharacterized protein with GYD domain
MNGRDVDRKETTMARYFIQGNYTVEGTKGLLKEGGTSRNDAVAKLAGSVGGALESLYFSATSPAYYIVMDLPERGSAAAVAATVVASGAVTVEHCVELLTPAQMDESAKKAPVYRAPGK